jgi:hypothetical protein
MAQIFHRSTNTLARVTLFGAVFFLAIGGWVLATLDRSAYNTGQGVVLEQPVPFSHDHHTAGLGIDCRYCHTSVETQASAGMPPTTTCMNCHKLIWNQSDMLAPVRESMATNEPIRWTRVHDLPDYVYFNHSIHVAKGVGCASCHGRVDEMPLIYQAESLQMEWCLACHRNPEAHVRPREEVFNMAWQASDQEALGAELVTDYHVNPRIDCSTCHR